MNSEPRGIAWIVGALVLALGCASNIRRFPMAEPMWEDEEDFRTFLPMPDEYYSPFAWDGADQMLFRPMARFFAVDPAGESVNVNAMDEVPDSSWFVNRLSRRALTDEEVLRGSCDDPPLDPAGPWTITSAKPNGANPGFIMEDAEGRKFLLKFDGRSDPERATAADVMGSLMYYAAGFHTPCNRIVFFTQDILGVDPEAEVEIEGEDVPMTMEQLAPMFERAPRLPDGRMRAVSSRFLPGRPLGPWRYESTRSDDPNDVINHEDRRELRGGYVLASWINHFDAREQNTLAMWITGEESERGYVRHNYIDFGDSFGSQWAWDGISRRLGHAAYFDMRTLLVDFITLGAVPRAWNRVHKGATGDVLGYFDDWYFEPDEWRPGYPNPAFLKASERDNAWMARAMANLTPEQIALIVDAAEIQNQLVRDELVRILQGRHERILQRWLRRLSPLTWPRVMDRGGESRLCLHDLAVSSGIVDDWEQRPYWSRAWQHLGGSELRRVEVTGLSRRPQADVCVSLPSAEATEDAPVYWIVDVAGLYGSDDTTSRPARVHLYQLGPNRYRVVGLERPYDLDAPGPRD